MDFTNLKNEISSIKYILNETQLPDDIKNKELNRKLQDLLDRIEDKEQEYSKIKKIAWDLANKLS